MKKKKYIKPEMNVFNVEMQAILAGSTLKFEKASEFNYSDETVKSFWDKETSKTIWSD